MPPTTRILILGASGMLGRYLRHAFQANPCETETVVALHRSAFDVLRDPWDGIPWDQYSVVINALGAIPQKYQDPNVLMRVNGDFPATVAPWCKRWIQVSTDGVFSGKRGEYTIDDVPDPVDDYGRGKRTGEVGLVVRGSFVGEGEAKALLETVRRSPAMDGYRDHFWNGVSALAMAQVLVEVARSERTQGFIHVAGPERVDKYALCQLIAAVYECPVKLTPRLAGWRDRTLVPTWPVSMPLRAQLEAQRAVCE